MKYYGMSEQPTYLTDESIISMSWGYWGASPLPEGAEIVGGYSDNHRAGALIRLRNGIFVCGHAGSISTIQQPKPEVI